MQLPFYETARRGYMHDGRLKSKPAKFSQQKKGNTRLFLWTTRPFIPLLIFPFTLQQLVREQFHFKKKNPKFRCAGVKSFHFKFPRGLERSLSGVRMGNSGPLERASLANHIQGIRIPDRLDASEKNILKDGASYCYCAYVLRNSGYSSLCNNVFARFMTMWEKQILARAIRIQKEN